MRKTSGVLSPGSWVSRTLSLAAVAGATAWLAACGSESPVGPQDLSLGDGDQDAVEITPADAADTQGDDRDGLGGDDGTASETADAESIGGEDVVAPSDDGITDTAPDPALLAKLADCKKFLVEAESSRALPCFRDAYKTWPDSIDAKFGVALSELVYGVELSTMMTSVTQQFGDPDAGTGPATLDPVPLPPDSLSQNEYLAAQIHSVFLRLRDHFVTAATLLGELEGADLHWTIDTCPVYMKVKPRLDYHGTFDAGDVLIMGALANGIAGFLDFLAGQDFDTDVLGLVSFVKNGASGSKIDWPTISHFVAYLLNIDPRCFASDTHHLLDVTKTDGEILFADAKTRFAAVAPKLIAGFLKAKELGDSGSDVSWVEDLAGVQTLKIRSVVHFGDDGTPTEDVLAFQLPQDVLAAFQACSDSIQTPGKLVTLHAGVIPVLGAMVVMLVRSGALEGLGLSLPIDLSAAEAADASALLQSLMPNVMAFDWGTFFQTPVGLAAWFPAWTTDKGMMQDQLVAEWECPADLAADGYPSGSLRLLCAKTAALQDGAHFAGASYATDADGIASAFPVFAFPDPTLSGLAYVNLDGVAGAADVTGYVKATNKTLNAALAKLLGGVLGLLGGVGG